MDSSTIIEAVLGLILATVLGAVVGFEREITHKPAGLRTHMLVVLDHVYSQLFHCMSLV